MAKARAGQGSGGEPLAKARAGQYEDGGTLAKQGGRGGWKGWGPGGAAGRAVRSCRQVMHMCNNGARGTAQWQPQGMKEAYSPPGVDCQVAA